MNSRMPSHIIEERSKDYIRTKVNNNENTLFREITGRDYGIDAIIEIFENNMPTGKIAFVQIKSTSSNIYPLITAKNYVSCPNISVSNLNYSFQNNIPVIVIYVSMKQNNGFYYNILNNRANDMKIKIKSSQRKVTIRIPVKNYILNDINNLIDEINKFYS